MKFYFKEFIKNNYRGKSNAYLFILWSVYKNLEGGGRLSNSIKNEVEKLNLDELNNKKEKGIRILSKLNINKREDNLSKYPYIKSIQIKNFRGFGSLNEFDQGCYVALDRKKNIFFGPNGSGKTSFCEAFEYKLTSKIKEAKRRNVSINEYIKRGDKRPEITLTFSDPKFDTDKLNEYEREFFQICFIEKNRLQEFALLGSKDTGVKEQDIIANLLSMQELDNLISSFVKPNSFNLENYLKTNSVNALEKLKKENEKDLILKEELESEKLQIHNDLVEKNIVESGSCNLDTLEKIIMSKENEKKTLEKKIKQLDLKEIEIVEHDKFYEKVYDIHQKVKKLKEIKHKISEQATEINYETFYNALNDLESKHIDKCPACNTPIKEVSRNPFEKAREELKKLGKITNLKRQLEDIESILSTESFFYVEKIVKDLNFNIDIFEELNQPKLTLMLKELNGFHMKDRRIEFVEKFVNDALSFNEVFSIYFKEQQKLVSKISESDSLIKGYREKIKEIDNYITELKLYVKRINSIDERLEKIKKLLMEYHANYQKLEQEKKKEDEYNSFVKEVETSYTYFYNDLVNFKIQLEKDRIKDIEEKVLEYYQIINRHDEESEYINDIKFKLVENNYRIYVSRAHDNTEVDAYGCLSEGHLRVLGLSLMLAVAEKNRVPFLIFDDVVNAIDSDHRANIIDMMFKHPSLQKLQLIITTHDRLFWERFCNTYEVNIDKKNASNISYIFNHTNKGTIIIQYNVGFESKIETALKNFDIRQALIYCRIWFETIAIQYCCDNRKELTARFSQDKKSNYLKPSLESIYSILINDFNDNENLSIIKNDLINWAAQNQEHHSFDENSYNFVHSKNSDEVSKIYYAIKRFLNDMYPEESIKKIHRRLEYINTRLEKSNHLLQNEAFLKKAPEEKVANEVTLNQELTKEKTELLEELKRLQNLQCSVSIN